MGDFTADTFTGFGEEGQKRGGGHQQNSYGNGYAGAYTSSASYGGYGSSGGYGDSYGNAGYGGYSQGGYGGYDASGGYSDAGYGGGMAVTNSLVQQYQHAVQSKIKSNQEHGRKLRKGPSDLKMFIGGLSHETTTDKLKEYFEKFGPVDDVDIKTDPSTGESRGFGFLLFKEEASIDEVINNGPHNLDGKRIDPKKATKNSKIFVGGLKPETTDESIKEYFSTYGEVELLDRGMDPQTGNNKPFAFMIMTKESAAGKIVEQHWHNIDSKRVECKLAVERNKRQDQFQGGNMGYAGYGGYAYNGPSFNQGYGNFQAKGNRYAPY